MRNHAVDGDRAGATEVEIYGAVYRVHGRDDSGYLQELAELVDARMREISERVRTVDSVKIAILAALNIADELHQCRERRVEIRERVSALAGELSAALDG